MAFFPYSNLAVIMNRQCRTVAIETESGEWEDVQEEWSDYGEVTFFDAVRQHSIEEAANSFIFNGKIKVETRDDDDLFPKSSIFIVELRITPTILNPRLDTDRITDERSVAPKRNLLTKFWGALS